MYDRQVRRRRAVLFALVACCLVLLTAYFGESSGGPLRSVQTGAMEVVAPVQEGANRALKPVRDLFGWFGDTLDAKDERDKLEAERDALRAQVARLQVAANENDAAARHGRLRPRGRPRPPTSRSRPRVYSRSNSSGTRRWRSTRARATACAANQPVINGKGLVGKVKTVSDGNAVVMLLSDSDFGVSALAAQANQPGSILPVGGLAGRPAARPGAGREGGAHGGHGRHRRHRLRAGCRRRSRPSIPIGRVKRIEGEGELDRTIHVAPFADLRNLDFVQVLTKPAADLRASTGSP